MLMWDQQGLVCQLLDGEDVLTEQVFSSASSSRFKLGDREYTIELDADWFSSALKVSRGDVVVAEMKVGMGGTGPLRFAEGALYHWGYSPQVGEKSMLWQDSEEQERLRFTRGSVQDSSAGLSEEDRMILLCVGWFQLAEKQT